MSRLSLDEHTEMNTIFGVVDPNLKSFGVRFIHNQKG
jgi:hypothetical protein